MINKIVLLIIISMCLLSVSCDKTSVETSGSHRRPVEDAKEDVTNNKLKYYVIGQPMAHDQHYKALLKRKCNIDAHFLGCTQVPPVREYAEKYNSLIIPIVEAKHGTGILDAIEKEAKQEWERSRGNERGQSL